MSDSILVLPSSYANNSLNIIQDTSYYKRSKELIGLLLDIGAVIISKDSDTFKFANFIAKSDRVNPNVFIGKLLGYIAEGIVVRACNENLISNRRWANIARVLKLEYESLTNVPNKIVCESLLDNPDEYKAIGIGFAKTSKDYGHLYNPQSNRDICWIHGIDDIKQLLNIEAFKLNTQKYAGLQIKVSITDNIYPLVNYFCERPYYTMYPVVYFDLGNNFNRVRQALLDIITGKNSKKKIAENSILQQNIVCNDFKFDEIIQFMLIRGKDVDSSLHEELEFYKFVLDKLALNTRKLLDLNNDSIIMALITEFLAMKNVISNNPNQVSILNLSV